MHSLRVQRQRRSDAAIGQPDIKRGQIVERDAEPAKGNGETGRCDLGRQGHIRARAAQAGIKPSGPDPVEHRNGRHIQRVLQGLANADLALEAPVEILRRIGPERHGPVLDQGFRMDQPVIESKAVKERFEGRPRRPARLRQIEKSAGAPQIRPAQIGQDGPGCVVGDDDGGARSVPLAAHMPGQEGFDRLLKIPVDAGRRHAARTAGARQAVSEPRGVHGEGRAALGHRFVQRLTVGAGGKVARLVKTGQDLGAALARGFGAAIRAQRFG